MKHRGIAILLCLCLLIGVLPMTAFAAQTYSITYDANGGKFSRGTVQTIGGLETGTQRIDADLEPTLKNYTFLGWSTDEDAAAAAYDASGKNGAQSINLVSDITLYAVWQPEVKSVDIQDVPNKMYVGDSKTLEAAVVNKDGSTSNVTVTWSCTNSDDGVAVIGKYTGEIIALDSGTAQIQAQAGSLSDTCSIRIKADDDVEVTWARKTLSPEIGQTVSVPDEDLEWVSTDPDVIKVEGDSLTALRAGTAVIYAYDDTDLVLQQVSVDAVLTLDANGGRFGTRRSYTDTLELDAEGGAVKLSDEPDHSNSSFVFQGWAWTRDAAKPDLETGDELTVSANATLYAVWEREAPEEWEDSTDTDWYDADEDEFYISTPDELAGLAELVNKGVTFEDCIVWLLSDIDLLGAEKKIDGQTKNVGLWTPIGSYSKEHPFMGELDGNGHTITGLYVSGTASVQGLFGYLGDEAVIRNLGVDGTIVNSASAEDSTYVGGIAGYADEASVENCWCTVSISTAGYAGGLIGYADGVDLENSWYAGTLQASTCGALLGEAEDCKFEACYYSNSSAKDYAYDADDDTEDAAKDEVNKWSDSEMYSEDLTEALNKWVSDQNTDRYFSWAAPIKDGLPDFVSLTMWSGKANTAWFDKNEVTFLITTAEELAGVAELVNSGVSFKGKEILLGADIYVGKQQDWVPIGTEDDPFDGIFDGRGHLIEAVSSDGNYDALGLFGALDGAMICNLGLKNCSFEQRDEAAVASLAALAVNSGIVNCWSDSSCESSKGTVGGIVGIANGSNILNCWFAGTVEGRRLVGAIAGQCSNDTTISSCYYTGDEEGCADSSADSTVSCENLTVKSLKAASFVDTLNSWVEAQNSEQYYSWKQQEGDYPRFGDLIIPVSAVSLDRSSLRLEPDETVTLTATVLPENTTYGTVTWSSSQPAVAVVEDGVVKALAKGETEISAVAGNKTAICRVKVGADDLEEADNSCYTRAFSGSGTLVKLSQQREVFASDALELCQSLGFDTEAAYSFKEEDVLTREMACELICKQILGKQDLEAAATAFSDVPDTRWSAGYIALLDQTKVLWESEDSLFMPDSPISGTEFCELLLAGIGRLSLDGMAPSTLDKALDGVQYTISLDEKLVNPKTVKNGSYEIGGVLVQGLAKTGIDIEAELLEDVICTTFLETYTGLEEEPITLSAVNILDEYAGTAAVSAYTFTGIENGAITQLNCKAQSLQAGSAATIVLYSPSGKFNSASVTLEKSNEVTFTAKIFGSFIIMAKDRFKVSDWDSMRNFQRNVTYTGFTDVDESLWYGTGGQGVVKTAVELGIMNGYSDGTFQPTGNIKLSEVIKMAAVVHNIYEGGSYTFDTAQGSKWYDTYVSYCIEEKIIQAGDFTDYEAYATRAEMAYVFAMSLPSFELINDVSFDDIPDVDAKTNHADQILALYGAGVLTGDAGTNAYRPDENVNRAEAAAIIARVALPSERQTFSN